MGLFFGGTPFLRLRHGAVLTSDPPRVIDIPHYHSFVVEASRPANQKAGWIFARENDNVIVGCTLTGQRLANIGDTTKDKLLEIVGMGGVRDTGTAGARKLEIYPSGNAVEWSLWYGPDNYSSGAVLP